MSKKSKTYSLHARLTRLQYLSELKGFSKLEREILSVEAQSLRDSYKSKKRRLAVVEASRRLGLDLQSEK